MSNLLFEGGPDLLEFGHTIQIAGAVYSSADEMYVLLFPDEPADRPATSLQLTPEQWQKLIRQTDLLETEILAQAEDGKLVKTIVRKSTRQIEQGVSWNVFRRDGYRCRYCWTRSQCPLWVISGH